MKLARVLLAVFVVHCSAPSTENKVEVEQDTQGVKIPPVGATEATYRSFFEALRLDNFWARLTKENIKDIENNIVSLDVNESSNIHTSNIHTKKRTLSPIDNVSKRKAQGR